ncbi:adenylosuccinate synthase [Halobaculum sp. MBLA0147]|uniref:adenylosuccinate synthase n=1 Tax=Halobaculum sp. MBLA0147 TaxID=3079934 RepID=UPI0035234E09
MTVTIVGTQLGDEGKGALVDRYGGAADVVVRYQGGDNAGHTVVEDGEEYALSLVPSGAIRGKTGVLGNGCVVNPETLFDELDALHDRGLDPDVRVARRAHVILPYHRRLDGIEEEAKAEDGEAIGTTGRGIGPTYEDKAGRRGVRVGDLTDPDVLREKLEYVVPQKRAVIEEVYGLEAGAECDVDALHEQYAEYGRRLADEGMLVDCGPFLAERRAAGDNLVFEGAQGTLIDVDHGNYPFVTSSNPTAGGATTGTGLGPTVVGDGEVVGVVKAYLSRVGSGAMPTELDGGDHEEALASDIRERGGEFGTVTGRPRRIGWLDVPVLRHAARVNGLTGISLNHLDVLGGLDELAVGHAYELDGDVIETVPATAEQWARCEPVRREFEPWPDVDWDAVAAEGYEALPEAAKTYVEYVEAETGVEVYAVGVGPDRAQTIERVDPWERVD